MQTNSWTQDHVVTTDASPDAVWALLADVRSWGEWNDGIETIEVDGPVAVGTTFRMTPPGEDTLTSTIVEFEPGERITDVTELDGIVVRVAHLVAAGAAGGTEIVYRIAVTGDVPAEVLAEIGGAVSADFPQVLAALASRAVAA